MTNKEVLNRESALINQQFIVILFIYCTRPCSGPTCSWIQEFWRHSWLQHFWIQWKQECSRVLLAWTNILLSADAVMLLFRLEYKTSVIHKTWNLQGETGRISKLHTSVKPLKTFCIFDIATVRRTLSGIYTKNNLIMISISIIIYI